MKYERRHRIFISGLGRMQIIKKGPAGAGPKVPLYCSYGYPKAMI